MKLFTCLLVAMVTNSFCIVRSAKDDLKLELLQVLFRHGDRTPDKKETYENDPYEAIYRQIGYGQLTKLGKQREYKIGQVLRDRYDDFLREYGIEDVYARSTNLDRTKMSLQLVLAGLYPPSNRTSWNDNMPWSPIPTHYLPQEVDFLSFIKCPRYSRMLAGQVHQARRRSKSTEAFFDDIKARMNGDVPTNNMLGLYNNLKMALHLNLPLPSWCSERDYEKLEKIAETYFATLTNSRLMSQIAAGTTIEQFLKNIDDHDNDVGAKKIYLYSTHDLNVAAFTNVHNFAGIPRIPDFGSSVIVEKLRGADDRVYLRMFLWTGVGERWIALKLENCDHACPLPEYERSIRSVLPDEASRPCNNSQLDEHCQKYKCSGEA